MSAPTRSNRAVKWYAVWTLVVECLVVVNGYIGRITVTMRDRNDKSWEAPADNSVDSIFK